MYSDAAGADFSPLLGAAEDNRSMNKERDLLPWIFGGLSAAAIAVAFAAVSTQRSVPASAPQVMAAQPAASPSALPAVTTAPAASATSTAAQPDSAPMVALAQSQSAAQAQAGQIWECMTQGVKTFSNNPCGEKSTLLDVGPINTMNPATTHYARAYGAQPRYAPGDSDQSAPAGSEDDSDSYGADSGANSYTIVQGVGFVRRRRPENLHRPYAPPAPPAPPAHHNSSGPVRRY
jgi:hypothetical protein